jgi:DNA-binding transcriptional ArsR family regulator
MNELEKNTQEVSVLDILKSEIRFRIFSLFHLYPELSLSMLKEITGKGKSTLHHHLEKLIDANLIEVSREEKVRGNIPAKFFSLKPGYLKELEHTDEDLDKGGQTTFEFYNAYLNFVIKTLIQYQKFFEKFRLEEQGSESLNNLLKESEGFSSMMFFTHDQFRRVHKLYEEFSKKLNEIEAEEDALKKEKPFYFFSFGMPLKVIIEELSKPFK